MSIVPINYSQYRSHAFNGRVRYLVLHYTAVDFRTSVELLSQRASAHYLVPMSNDPSYRAEGFDKLQVFNLVDESQRAWHAGVSRWQGQDGLNDTSIGIEIVNLASDNDGVFTFPDYDTDQMALVIALARNILERYPDISPTHVVAHSDIAPGRKSDPGPQFPWKRLFDAGIGAWYDEDCKNRYLQQFHESLPTTPEVINQLSRYGYAITESDGQEYFTSVIRAFQLHFRAHDYSGKLDAETAAILYALAEKYVN